ncbi:MAG: BlaI/MecI/CopY family transcriptional regulator [Fervidicoccaceae archaeon]
MRARAKRAQVYGKLKKVYDDGEVTVVLAPNELELETILIDIINELGGAATVRDIHSFLEAIASEEKIRKVLHKLVSRGLVRQHRDGRYELVKPIVTGRAE